MMTMMMMMMMMIVMLLARYDGLAHHWRPPRIGEQSQGDNYLNFDSDSFHGDSELVTDGDGLWLAVQPSPFSESQTQCITLRCGPVAVGVIE